jgi:hypothetical protein
MPSLNTFALIRWRVDWVGGTPTVNPEVAPPATFTMLVPDGATSTDAQVIAQYVLGLAAADQQAFIQLVRDGLATVVPVQKTAVAVPPVPPQVRAAGPPAPAAPAAPPAPAARPAP